MLHDYCTKTNLYWDAKNARAPQTWATPHKDVFKGDFYVIKKFRGSTNGEAVLVNPPMAGHHSNIAQTLVNFYLNTTEHAVYSIEWLPATKETKDYGIEEIVNHVGFAVNKIAETQTPHLAGLCQGGWAVAMWVARNPHRAKSLILAGTPIDFKIDGGKCQSGLSMTSDRYIRNIIDAHDGVWPGENQLMGFKMLNPADRFFGTYADLWNLIDAGDAKGIRKWIRNNSWYEYAQDLPGEMIKPRDPEKIGVVDLFRHNHLINGEVVINGETVELGKITCPVVAITGDDDDITLTRQGSAILDHVSSEKKLHLAIPECGHIAIFLAKAAMERWQQANDFINVSLGGE